MNYVALAKAEQERAPEGDLVLKHLDIALQAAKITRTSLDFHERLAIANLKLVEAAKTWPESDAKKQGVSFAGYAYTRMRDAIVRASGDIGIGISYGRYVRMQTVQREADDLRKRLNRKPTPEEIAHMVGISAREVRTLQRLLDVVNVMSLDMPLNEYDEDAETAGDTIADESADTEAMVLDKMQASDEQAKLRNVVESLPPAYRLALSLRAGVRVPSCETVTIDDALRVAVAQANLTTGAIDRIRKDGVERQIVLHQFGQIVHDPFDATFAGATIRDTHVGLQWGTNLVAVNGMAWNERQWTLAGTKGPVARTGTGAPVPVVSPNVKPKTTDGRRLTSALFGRWSHLRRNEGEGFDIDVVQQFAQHVVNPANRVRVGEKQSDGEVPRTQVKRVIPEHGPTLPRLQPGVFVDVDVHERMTSSQLANNAPASWALRTISASRCRCLFW